MVKFSQVKAKAQELGVSCRKTGFGSEIRIANRDGKGGTFETSAYYTDCCEDALATLAVWK